MQSKKIKSFLILLFFSFFIYSAKAQVPKTFSNDPVKFLLEMQSFLEETNKKETEKLMEKFTPVWNSGKISAQQKTLVYETSNAMLKKRMKAFPDFVNYLNAIMGFVESNQTPQSFDNWHKSLDKLVKATSRKYSDYLEISYNLFLSNTLYESPTVRWSADKNTYTFEFDTLPKIIFSGINLTCTAKGDSSVIYSTKGAYYPNLKKFFGNGGKIYWTRAGIPQSDAYADLKKYSIDLTGNDYTLDSVTFYVPKYFATPLKGRVFDKLLANIDSSKVTYPRFTSYNQNLEIKELIKDANYKGGFSLYGNKMVGSGSTENDAKLSFMRSGKPFMVFGSKSFVVKPDRIVSDKASVNIFWEKDGKKDSIYHPGIELKYLKEKREISVLTNTQTNTSAPFFDSYHQVDMYFDQLTWKLDDPLIDLKIISGAGEVKLSFESSNFYRDQRFQRIQGVHEQSPLYTLKKYAEKTGTRMIYVKDLAQDMRMAESQIRGLFLELAAQGFLIYDGNEDRAVLKDRLYYYLQANIGKVDYDIIQFDSQISGKPNATINLLNFEINMRGVSKVALSDTQNVFIVPLEQEMVLKKNRDFTFAGRVHAGNLDFFGKDFSFDYEKFKITLNNVDSLRLKVLSDTVDLNGKFPKIPLKSVIQNMTGELYIDREENKSSYQKSPDYPILKSTKESFVYYEYQYIFDSIYRHDNFYFKNDPFTIDSLDNFRKEGLAFAGTFNSAGIFAPMRETLVTMPDFSLGFFKTTPPEGLLAYNGKGTYHNRISLSHRGLRGDGQIDFLSSHTQSSDVKFFPDSANADATAFEIERKTVGTTAFPHVKAEDVYINWRPKEDKMFVFKKTKNMELYDNKASLDGNLVLASKGINANGKISFEQAELLSNNFYIKEKDFGADTSDFHLNSNVEKVFALETKNMKSKIDLEKRVGEFASNGSGSYVTFPLNQYICFIENFKWFMDNKDIQLASVSSTKNAEGAEFVSINPMQDSLRWFAPDANYNLADYVIRAKKVKQILVADASIIPDSGKVVIEKDAKMQTLTNSKVIANTTSKYHAMVNTTIDITGRKNYSGVGEYDYKDMAGVKHLIKLTQIGVDTSRQTFANGEIPDSQEFAISPNVQYKGKISFHAANKLLHFSGFARLNHGCEKIEKNWFGFASEIDPAGVIIPVREPKNETGEKLSVAIVFASDSANVYSSFLSQKPRASDNEILSAEGSLKYNTATKEYTVIDEPAASKNKKDDKSKKDTLETPVDLISKTSGNYLTLNDQKCIVYGEGKINIGSDFGQFKFSPVGSAKNDMIKDAVEFDVIADLDFMFNEDALKFFANTIIDNPTLPPTVDSREVYKRALAQILGKEKADKVTSETNLYGTPRKIPEELQHSIVLTDLKFYWDKASLTFRSKGDIGVGFIGKNAIGRMLKGYFEIQRKRTGDAFNLYLEINPSMWYFFNYQRGVMQAVSSESKFNDFINNMKEEKRVADEKGGKMPYQYMVATVRKKSDFVRRFTGKDE
ncbi:MAG TPA: hypothetical protein VJY62_18960 [Bacteroidia bacterium]|nr:hypothetical protein [Bacteroidia bacterium]